MAEPAAPAPMPVRVFFFKSDDAKVAVCFDRLGGLDGMLDAASAKLGFRPAAVYKDARLVGPADVLDPSKLGDLDLVRFEKDRAGAAGSEAFVANLHSTDRVVGYVSRYDALEAAAKSLEPPKASKK